MERTTVAHNAAVGVIMIEHQNFCSLSMKQLSGKFIVTTAYTIRYDTVYLTCSKKLTGSQLSPPHII